MKNTPKYKITVIKIKDLDNDLRVIEKWLQHSEPGQYEIVVKKVDE